MSRRLDSFLRDSLTSTGTCAHDGGSWPSASHSSCCLGVLGRCSSPRTTWVMPISMSSTTLASTKIGRPLPRSRTKSSIESLANVTSPRTASWTTVVPVRDAEAQRPGPGPGSEAAVAGVAVVAGLAGLLGPGLDLLAGQVAVVRLAVGVQALGRGDVGRGVGALEVRALEHRVVGADAQPGQGVDDALGPLGPVAGLVGVLDPQHERAAELAGQRPVVERRARPADVEEPRRRRCDAEAGTVDQPCCRHRSTPLTGGRSTRTVRAALATRRSELQSAT